MADFSPRRAATLLRAGPQAWLLAIEALGELRSAERALRTSDFRTLAEGWGQFVQASDVAPSAAGGALHDRKSIRQIGWAVRSVASIVPFKAMCLQQAIAARRMLARRGIPAILHYGAGRDESGVLVAHAWIEAEGERLTGYPVPQGIAAIGAFIDAAAAGVPAISKSMTA